MVRVGKGSSNMPAVFEKTPTGGRLGGPEAASGSGSEPFGGVMDSTSGSVAPVGAGADTGAGTGTGTGTGADADTAADTDTDTAADTVLEE